MMQAGQVSAADVQLVSDRVSQLDTLVRGGRVQLNRSWALERRINRTCLVLGGILSYRQWLEGSISRYGGFLIILAAGIADSILLTHWISGSISVNPLPIVLSAIVSGSIAAVLTFYPADQHLNARLAEATASLFELRNRIACEEPLLDAQENSLSNELGKLSQLRRAINSRRHTILASPWHSFAGTVFELFLQQVFEENGYAVQLVGQTGDQGVDLIVSVDGRRVAVQAKGYPGSTVGNSAIQEVHAGMTYHGCHSSVVITNSRFTSSALALAERVGCQLIDGAQIPALINGEIRL